jgi:nitrogen fixation-related uncharacterized protein
MIFRILLLFLVIWGLFWILRKQFSDDSPRSRQQDGAEEQAEDMLVCETCGVHTPKSLTVQVDGKVYCCHEHIPAPERQKDADDG